jgi:hypothetical protein
MGAETRAGMPPQDFCEDSVLDIQTIKSHERQVSAVIYVPWLLLLADMLAAITITAAVLQEKPPEPPMAEPEYRYVHEKYPDSPEEEYF